MAHPVETRSVNAAAFIQQPAGKPLRVLSVIPAEAEGPSMIFVKRQVAALQDLGVINRPFFLSSRTSPAVLLREWRRLRRQIREFGPDLLHAHFGTMTAFFCMFSGRLPLVVTYRGSDLNPSAGISRLRSGVGKLLSQIAALRASRIICVSEQLKGRLFWTKRRATVIPSGVDTRVFYPRPRDEARSELGWGTQERVVLFNAGRFPRVKRLDLAQAAVEVARGICGEIRFVVLEGYTDPEVVPTMMNGADCLLFTSDWEGSPNVVKEAMACNLPVVSVDVGDVRERLAMVSPSRIVARNPQPIGEALAEILAQGRRSNGYLAIPTLSQDKIVRDILSVYQETLGSG
jgi:teichuronic acid biosynthesis glycosyltransferase TuaC